MNKKQRVSLTYKIMNRLLKLRIRKGLIITQKENIELIQLPCNGIRVVCIGYLGAGISKNGGILLVKPAVKIMIGMPANDEYGRCFCAVTFQIIFGLLCFAALT